MAKSSQLADGIGISPANPLVHAAYPAAASQQATSGGAMVSVYSGLVTIKPDGQYKRSSIPERSPAASPGGPRGKVTSFSKAARRRMIRFLNQVNPDRLGKPVFLSLTYHNNYRERNPKQDRTAFLKRVARAYPGCHWIWRLEYQRRGAPHWHIILWPEVDVDLQAQEDQLCQLWHEVVDPKNIDHAKYGARVVPLSDQRGVNIYMTKYLSRLDGDEQQCNVGRRWGHSRGLPTEPLAEFKVTEEVEILVRRLLRDYLKRQCDSRGRPSRWTSELQEVERP